MRAAGFLGVVGLLRLVSNRTVFGCVWGSFWKLDVLFRERTRVVCSGIIAGVCCLVDSCTNFRLTTSRSLPTSQTGWSQIELSPGLHHFMCRWSRLVFPPMGLSLVAVLMCPGASRRQFSELQWRLAPWVQHQLAHCLLGLSVRLGVFLGVSFCPPPPRLVCLVAGGAVGQIADALAKASSCCSLRMVLF